MLAEDAILARLPRVRGLLALLHKVATIESSAGCPIASRNRSYLLLGGRLCDLLVHLKWLLNVCEAIAALNFILFD